LDDKGFVVDFGDLKFIKQWFQDELDHAYVFNADDSETEKMLAEYPNLFNAYPVACCSAEGLAQHAFENIAPLLKEHHGARVFLVSVEVLEDSKNAAVYRP